MTTTPDFSESFYRQHAQRYAEVSHNFIQSVYTEASHPELGGDRDLMERVLELVPPGSRGLDAGCGAGARDVYFYWQRGYDVYGVDAVEENILEARKLHPEIADRVEVADLRKALSYPDGSFEFVLCNAVIQHIQPDVVLGTTLPQLARVLSTGGLLQLMFKHGDGVATVYDKDYGVDRTFQLYAVEEVLDVLAGQGLRVVAGGKWETRRGHVLQGPQAHGSLRSLRPQGRVKAAVVRLLPEVSRLGAGVNRLEVPRNLGEITPRWLSQALVPSRDSGSSSVTGYSVETIAGGTGFINQVFRLRLHYDHYSPDLPGTVIAKLPSADPPLRTVSDRLGQNRRELSFYEELANSPDMPTPRVYHSGMDPGTGTTFLLLEDMIYARQGDSVAGCTLEDARRCIGQLARFHASWWDSPLLESLDWMPLREADASAYEQIYAGAWAALIEKAGGGMPPGLRVLGDHLIAEMQNIKARLTRHPRTVVHGDYRLDNCFFPTGADSQQVVVIDWEFCTRGRGAYDVATFVSDAFSPGMRREVEMGLLREYHSTLEERGVSGYSFEECLYDYRLSILDLFVFWIVTGGYCDYETERADVYLRNTLERLDAAVADLIGLASESDNIQLVSDLVGRS